MRLISGSSLGSLGQLFSNDALRSIFKALVRDPCDKAFIVGGCIRDAIIGRETFDIDIATNLVPSVSLDRLRSLGKGHIVDSAIEYGSIVIFLDGYEFAVTTFRKDIQTFGRSAVVEQTDDILEDAKRRDFTINALYLDFDGNIFDFFGGLEDLKGGIVRFIGNPEERIREDYLRIFRFFRFVSLFGNADLYSCHNGREIGNLSRSCTAKPESNSLHLQTLAIRKCLGGIRVLSKERVSKELSKTVQHEFCADSFYLMQELCVLDALFAGKISLAHLSSSGDMGHGGSSPDGEPSPSSSGFLGSSLPRQRPPYFAHKQDTCGNLGLNSADSSPLVSGVKPANDCNIGELGGQQLFDISLFRQFVKLLKERLVNKEVELYSLLPFIFSLREDVWPLLLCGDTLLLTKKLKRLLLLASKHSFLLRDSRLKNIAPSPADGGEMGSANTCAKGSLLNGSLDDWTGELVKLMSKSSTSLNDVLLVSVFNLHGYAIAKELIGSYRSMPISGGELVSIFPYLEGPAISSLMENLRYEWILSRYSLKRGDVVFLAQKILRG